MKQALPTILAPATMPSASDQIRLASAELNKAMNTDEGDELRNHRSLLSALQDYNKTMVEELKKNEKFQTAMEEQNQMAAISNAKDDSTPMGKAQNELKAGNLDAAINDISAAVNKFDKMSDADQQKMINQAKVLAQELSNAANDPKTMQKSCAATDADGSDANRRRSRWRPPCSRRRRGTSRRSSKCSRWPSKWPSR